MPFEQLVDSLDVQRSLSHSPLFQAMLVLQNAQTGDFELPNLTATTQPLDFPFAKFDLTLNMMEQRKGLGLWATFEYATDIFDEATIARMANHFTVLLQGIVNQPGQSVQQLPMLTDTEQYQIVHESVSYTHLTLPTTPYV